MKITGIGTIRNAIEVGYPLIESLLSIYPMVDELRINDGGSNDGTLELLEKLSNVYPKIILSNIEDRPTKQWKVIDEHLMSLMRQSSDADWFVHTQADELFHEHDIPIILDTLEDLHENKYNGIRQWRKEAFFGYVNHDGYKYRIVRIFRNTGTIFSRFGGDDFLIDGIETAREGFSTHNLRPEYDTRIPFYHYSNLYISKALDKAKRHTFHLALEHKNRTEIFNNLQKQGESTPYEGTIHKDNPMLIRTITNTKKYEVRESLFDPDYLMEITGLNYK